MPSIGTVSDMIGVLNIDKPTGMTSHDVVSHVRKIVHEHETQVGLPAKARRSKVGHAGTLDPFATGVLLVAVGPATRLIQFSHDWDKEYEATIILGATSDTDDVTGEISQSKIHSGHQIQKEEILKTLQRFIGEIEQVPPAYAAVKMDGEKLYEKARRGEMVKAEPRLVAIHEIELMRYEWPELELRVRCGTGTYIRALARDIGKALGVGGYVSALRRTQIGKLTLDSAIQLDQLTETDMLDNLLPPEKLIEHLSEIILKDSDATKFRQGTQLDFERAQVSASGQYMAIFNERKKVIGVGKKADGKLSPHVVLAG